MFIAFCTSCMNRRWQLELTLEANLEQLRGTGHFIALCNYGSEDGLDEFVRTRFGAQLQDGTLSYFHTRDPASFHMSMAKNLAHRLALLRRPDVLFNLDADNFVTGATLTSVTRIFGADARAVLHNWSWNFTDGTSGRIALHREQWMRLGGYDETFLPMGVQDIDLLYRCRAAGLRYVLDRVVEKPPVQNDMGRKLDHVASDATELDAAERYRLMVSDNFSRSYAAPIYHRVESQRRFLGTLNGQQRLVL